jgi:ATP-dependent HslUV protease ATP-binding subunit HslU
LTNNATLIHTQKTEVARRMAKLTEAPFIKVEATKFTEVGYHGRDVDSIVRDLMDVSMQLTKRVWTDRLKEDALQKVEERILDLLTGPAHGGAAGGSGSSPTGRDSFRDMLRQGLLDEQEIEVDVPQNDKSGEMNVGGEGSNPNVVVMTDLFQRMSGQGKKHNTERKKLTIAAARDVILQIELDKLLEQVDLKKEAVTAVEESGIVFIDEIGTYLTCAWLSAQSTSQSTARSLTSFHSLRCRQDMFVTRLLQLSQPRCLSGRRSAGLAAAD